MTEKKPGEPKPDPFDVADCLLDEWESSENETLRDGHRSTLRRLIADGLVDTAAQARREGAREALERAAEVARDKARAFPFDGPETAGVIERAIRALADQPEAVVVAGVDWGVGESFNVKAPAKVLPPCDSNASKAEILYNHEKRIAFLEKIACGGPVLYNEKRVLSLAEPPHPPAKADAPGTCALCGKPMPRGEEMFKYHGYSGPCPAPEAAHGRKK